MSILAPVSWQSDARDCLDHREHVRNATFGPSSSALVLLTNFSDLRTSFDDIQMFNMEQSIASPLRPARGTVKATPFSTQFAPSKSDWEEHRTRILQLYMHEGKTLKEIMQIMQEKYSFKATIKMYKNRLKCWNARKYMTKAERDVVSRVMQARKRSGEPIGRVVVRGKDKKLDVFLRHMGQSRSRAHQENVLEDGDLSQDIIIDNPTSLHCPVFLSPLLYPAGLEKTVEILCGELPHLVLKTPEEGLSYELFYAMKRACISSGSGSSAEVRLSLNLAEEWFRANIAARPALALMSLLRSQTITGYDWFYCTGLFKRFYQHLFELTQVFHGSQNSLTKLVLHILQMPREPRVMQLTFQNLVTEIIKVLQKHNSSETYQWQGFLAVKLQKTEDKVRARKLLVDAVSSFDKDDVYRDDKKWLCKMNLARQYIADASNMDEEAEYMLSDLMEARTDTVTRKVNPWHAYHVFGAFGQLAEKRGEFQAAVDFYRLRIQVAVGIWGQNNILTLHALETLVRLLRSLKREEEAVVLEKRIRLEDELIEIGFE
jgi:hypothetical protein